MNLRPRFRSYLSILLTCCLVSMSMWSYGAEATADNLAMNVMVQNFPGGLDFPDHDGLH